MADVHPGDDALLDVVLTDSGGDRRDEVVAHLARCGACRAEHDALAEAARLVLAAAPAVPAPAGLERAVLGDLAALTGAREMDRREVDRDHPDRAARRSPDQRTVSPDQPARARRDPGGPATEARGRPVGGARRRAWELAAAAVLGLLLGAAGTAAVLDDDGPEVPVAGEGAVSGPALVAADGSRVGTVLESRFDGRPVLVVTVTTGGVGVEYACDLVLADGGRLPAGSWVLREPTGATWVVVKPERADVVGVELVAADGRTWATARL